MTPDCGSTLMTNLIIALYNGCIILDIVNKKQNRHITLQAALISGLAAKYGNIRIVSGNSSGMSTRLTQDTGQVGFSGMAQKVKWHDYPSHLDYLGLCRGLYSGGKKSHLNETIQVLIRLPFVREVRTEHLQEESCMVTVEFFPAVWYARTEDEAAKEVYKMILNYYQDTLQQKGLR
jgi:hypothetical protein